MDIFFYIVISIFGLLFWSFSSVLIHRLKSWEKWIWSGRSHCNNCNTTLKSYDLIPIFSWLSTLWKCRYCKKSISAIYPILELSTALVFLLISIFVIDINLVIRFDALEITKLFFWLIVWFITILYIYYDILFLEIHEWIMLSWVIIWSLWVLANQFSIPLVWTLEINNINSLFQNIVSIIFYTISIAWLYYIMLKELKIRYDLLILWIITLWLFAFKYFWFEFKNNPILSWFIWAFAIYVFFFLQIVLSGWRALWWGDLRIAIMIWILLWISYSFPAMMIVYLVWSIVSVFIILVQKLKSKWGKINTQVPFGPFLWIWFLITIMFQNYIDNIISIYFKNM